MMTANFLAVAEIADTLPLWKAILLKKLDNAVSFRFTIIGTLFYQIHPMRAIRAELLVAWSGKKLPLNNPRVCNFCIHWQSCTSLLFPLIFLANFPLHKITSNPVCHWGHAFPVYFFNVINSPLQKHAVHVAQLTFQLKCHDLSVKSVKFRGLIWWLFTNS